MTTEPESDSNVEKGYDDAPTRPKAVARLVKLLDYCGRVRHLIGPVVQVMQPAYMRKCTKTTKLRPTAYLDGIRGFAAFLVYWLHHNLWAHAAQGASEKLQNAWGYDGQYYLAAFHGIRTFVTGGHFAVATFFVLSGYVLSAKPLALINAGELSKLGDNLASGLFRRWLRLFLPIIIVTFLLLSSWHIFGVLADFIPEPTYGAEIWRWYINIKNFTFVFRLGDFPTFMYHAHTWTIPIEFRGSIVIYTVLLSLSRFTRRGRMACQGLLMFYLMYIADGSHYAMFVAGMFLCDLDYLLAEIEVPAWLEGQKLSGKIFFHVLFAISIYLGGSPSESNKIDVLRDSPGWYYLSWLKPQAVFDYKWFYLFWAATILVFTVPRIGWLKRFFETRFCQYLGRISYMFYLMHGPVLWTVGDRLYAAVGLSREEHALSIPGWSGLMPIPAYGPFALELNFFVPHLILLPLTLWLAEVATTVIDDNSIAVCAWLYKRLTASPSDRLVSP